MTTAKNDVTGDALRSRPTTEKYRDNWDLIFGTKKSKQSDAVRDDDNKEKKA